jgi:rubredoxin
MSETTPWNADDVLTLARHALKQVRVEDTVDVAAVRPSGPSDSPAVLWIITFRDRGPRRLSDKYDLHVVWHANATREGVQQAIRAEVRKKSWLCPVCQRRGEIERTTPIGNDLDVDCPSCGVYRIDTEIAQYFRRVADGDNPAAPRVLELANRLSETLALGPARYIGPDWPEIARTGFPE